jgi:hypothetical protein
LKYDLTKIKIIKLLIGLIEAKLSPRVSLGPKLEELIKFKEFFNCLMAFEESRTQLKKSSLKA